MFTEISIGGVAIPGLLAHAFMALFLTALTSRLLTNFGIYQLFSHRPLAELSLFVIWLGLLVQFAHISGMLI